MGLSPGPKTATEFTAKGGKKAKEFSGGEKPSTSNSLFWCPWCLRGELTAEFTSEGASLLLN
jgi:hypothetical protein